MLTRPYGARRLLVARELSDSTQPLTPWGAVVATEPQVTATWSGCVDNFGAAEGLKRQALRSIEIRRTVQNRTRRAAEIMQNMAAVGSVSWDLASGEKSVTGQSSEVD